MKGSNSWLVDCHRNTPAYALQLKKKHPADCKRPGRKGACRTLPGIPSRSAGTFLAASEKGMGGGKTKDYKAADAQFRTFFFGGYCEGGRAERGMGPRPSLSIGPYPQASARSCCAACAKGQRPDSSSAYIAGADRGLYAGAVSPAKTRRGGSRISSGSASMVVTSGSRCAHLGAGWNIPNFRPWPARNGARFDHAGLFQGKTCLHCAAEIEGQLGARKGRPRPSANVDLSIMKNWGP